jgi:hypothetical protein
MLLIGFELVLVNEPEQEGLPVKSEAHILDNN